MKYLYYCLSKFRALSSELFNNHSYLFISKHLKILRASRDRIKYHHLIPFLVILFLISISFADSGNSTSYRSDIEIGTFAEPGNSTNYRAVAGSSLSGERSNSTSYFMELGILPTATRATDDLSFTIYIPANNVTGRDTTQFSSTDTIIFNITDVGGKKINATAAGGQGGTQTDTVSIFRYENTGTIALNITLNFTDAVPLAVTVKAGWGDASYQSSCSSENLLAAGTCANISVGGANQAPVIVANLTAVGALRDVWLWADYNTYTAGSDIASTLTHSSRKTA